MKIIKSSDPNAIKEAIKVLSTGGLVVYPTETCYGLAADATSSEAVDKLLEYKDRPEGKAISIAVDSEEMAEKYVEVNTTAKNIYTEFLPGPITVVSISKHNTDIRLESENGTLGIRIPDNTFALELIKTFGKPVTATTAAPSGKKTPYTIEDILDSLGQKHRDLVDLIIDDGELPKNLKSTVIDTTSSDQKTYREGAIKFANINIIETFKSESVEDTISFAEKLTLDLLNQNKPITFFLSGKLGAGKTHFTKGVARALGIKNTIKSPTYTYVEEHKFNINDKSGTLFHVDAWKLENLRDLELMNYQDWFANNNVVVIEWPEILIDLSEKQVPLQDVLFVNISGEGETRNLQVYKTK